MKKTKNLLLNSKSIFLGIVFIACPFMLNAQSDFPFAVADGYASGTTGGAGGTTVTVSSSSAFKSACESSSKMIIIVDGNIDITSLGRINVKSDKTIIGKNSSSGYKGCLSLSGVSNIIIQNLNISNPGGVGTGDGIEASNGCTKIFVTKCTFSDCADGSYDMKRGSTNLTVSWCRFRYPSISGHNFPNLIGHSDDNGSQDEGKLYITMHHNWYDAGADQRMPRVRFGHVHVYNNYYGAHGNSYCIGTGVHCHIRVESSYFDDVNNAWKDYNGMSNGGEIGWNNLKMVSTSTPSYAPNKWPVFTPSYSFSMDNVNDLKSIVANTSTGAGNCQPNGGTTVTHVTGVTISSASVSVKVGSTTQLSATVAPSNATDKSVSWSSNNTSVATVNSSGVVTGVSAGSATITVTTNDGNKTASSSVTVTGSSGECTWVEYQAEDGSYSAGSVDNNNAGFTGTGFVNTDNVSGVWYEINVNVSSAGTYNINVRYANGASEDRTQEVSVNGSSQISSLSFPTTGSWTTWTTTEFSLNLSAGSNTIRFTSLTSSGAPNLDRIDVCQGGGSGNVSVTGVAVTPTSASVSVGGTTQLSAVISPSDATNQNVSWSSNNTSVATVNSSGVVTGVAAGSATITVTTADGNKTASTSVSVSGGTGIPCSNPETISLSYSYDGAGEYCWFTDGSISYINSWNMNSLTINGTDYTNVWSNSMPARINGGYYISYNGSYAWSHFEASALKAAESNDISKDLTVYPNPVTQGTLNIRLPEAASGVTVKILSSTGQVLQSEKVENQQMIKINLNVSTGLYLLQVENGSSITTTKLIVK